MADKKVLIVNADDFGMSPGVNRGIITAHELGIVTSASLMVRWPATHAAAVYEKEHSELSLGLHVDLGEWAYRDGQWVAVYEVVPQHDFAAVKKEVSCQLDSFRQIVGKDPTHIDSHQHVHRREPAHSILVEIANHIGVPLRHYTSEIRYCGDFYGQTAEGQPFHEAISVESLIKIFSALPAGTTEMACHPGEVETLETMYRIERAQEVQVLCDPQIRDALVAADIHMASFSHPILKENQNKYCCKNN